MGTFGERLQREREMRSITLQEISGSTKISTRMLKALEEEDFKKLPGGIFNKGFVRAYCRYLGIDEEQAVADYLAALAENDKSEGEKKTTESGRFIIAAPGKPQQALLFDQQFENNRIVLDPPNTSESSDPMRHLMAAVVVLVILIGGAGLAKYVYDRSETVSAKNSVSVAPVEQAAPTAVQAQVAPEQATHENAAADPTSTQTTSDPSATVAKSENVVVSNSNNVGGDGTVAAADNNNADQSLDRAIRVQIHAKEDSWVRIQGDGKLIMEGLIKASSDKSFRATKDMIVTLGNAGGVNISYNGRSMPSFTAETKYKQIIFDLNGTKGL